MMLWLPWSPLGCVAAFFAVLEVCQAHSPKDNPEYYIVRGDSRDPEERVEASNTAVEICENNPLNPPCTTVEAPSGRCVAIPHEFKNVVSGVRAHETASICRFYLEPDCKGEYFEAGTEAVDLYTARPEFNDKVASFVCDTANPMAASKLTASNTAVEICENNPLNPPCTTVEAPSGRCVAIPHEFKNVVSGVRAHETASICRFYLEPDCKGEYFEAGTEAVDLYTARPEFNDKVASFVCDTANPMAASKLTASNTAVEICENNPLNPPCTTVEAPSGRCVAIPHEFKNVVSVEPDCKGEYFEAGTEAVDLYTARPEFNDKVASFVCDTANPMAASKLTASNTAVEICENNPLNPPCTTVEAPSGRCVAIPHEFKNVVSGVRAHETASICRFYLEPDCKGEYFEAGTEAVDLYTARPEFNDKVASFVCDTANPMAASKLTASNTAVEICENNPLNPPCTTVEAPSGRCVAIPHEFKNVVSGVRAHETASICRFYLEPDCKGEYFEAGTEAVDLYTARPEFNDKVASFVCDTANPMAASKPWEWSFKRQKQLCTRLDKLTLQFKLANNTGSGTYDKIKLAFEDAGQNAHVITEGPSPGYEVSQDINIQDVFGMETVALSQINRLSLLDELTDSSVEGDVWEIIGFTLRGRCANSGMNIALEKFSSLNKLLQIDPDQPGRFQYRWDWEVWAGDVKPQEWVTKSLCKHFQSMRVSICISPMQTGTGVSPIN
ncbi:hypothetical protein ACQRIT_002953 [Beauveria bassiana]